MLQFVRPTQTTTTTTMRRRLKNLGLLTMRQPVDIDARESRSQKGRCCPCSFRSSFRSFSSFFSSSLGILFQAGGEQRAAHLEH